MLRSPFTWLALFAVIILAGPRMCSSPPAEEADVAKAGTPGTPAPKAEPPPAPWWANGPGAIVSVSPERLKLHGDEVAPQTLDVSYRIREPESVLEAWLELQVSAVGNLARMDVPIQANGSVRFAVSSNGHSLGPHVQFRAICPQGATEWHSLGTPPPLPSAPLPDVLQIDRVSPDSIKWSMSTDPAYGGGGGAIRVSISGQKLTGDCRVEAQVNRSSVELRNVRFTGRRFEGLLRYEDINYDEVASRYADLKLVVRRKGSRMATVRVLPFD